MQSPDMEEWQKEIKNEKAQFNNKNKLTPLPQSSSPPSSKVLSTMWVMNMKSNGTHQGRLNAMGYKQLDGSHYASDSIALPMTNPITVQIMPMLFCMNPTWMSAIIDTEGAILQE